MAATKDTSVTSIDDEPVQLEKPKAVTAKISGEHFTGEQLEVVVQAGQDDLGGHAVFLAINGHSYNIPRGIPVILPVEAVEVLENAMTTKYETVAGKQVEREVPRFSFTAKPVKAAKK